MMFSFWDKSKQHQKIDGLETKYQQLVNDYLEEHRPARQNLICDSDLIAVDFETTGLDPTKDEIISMGFCPIQDDIIRLADCAHIIIKPKQILTSENVAIHGLTDDVLEQGLSQQQALFKFIELTLGKIIVAHHHIIERTFLQTSAKQILGRSIPLSFIDSMEFAKLRMQRRQQTITTESLRLFNLRRKQGLPNYKAHNALEDAISTAELYLAQKASLGLPEEKIRLKDMGLYNYKS